jgi:hypothetical protein
MANTETTNTVTTIEFEPGMMVFNKEFDNFERTGQIIQTDNGSKVRFYIPESKKFYTQNISDKWQAIPKKEKAILAAVVVKTEPDAAKVSVGAEKPLKTNANGKESDITEQSEPDFVALTEDETKLKAQIEKEFRANETAIENKQLRNCELLDLYRDGKLYRAEYKTFEECALAVFGMKSREYAQNRASIGAFYRNNKDFVLKNKLSLNTIDSININNNRIAETLPEGVSPELVESISKEVLSIAVESAKGNKRGLVERVVNTSANAVLDKIADLDGKDLIKSAMSVLGENRDSILESVKETLTAPKSPNANGTNTGETKQTYTGVLPSLSIECSLHTSQKSQKVILVSGNTLQMKCGCKFRLVGFDLIPIEVKGKTVKAEKA